ncbi:TonB-dependent receptor [Gammaproteobacteria bacterium AS21]
MTFSISPLCLLGSAIVLACPSITYAADSEDTIFVSAKAPIKAQEFSGSVSVVTAAQIKARGANSVSEALELLPGVSISATGGNGGDEIKIRGLSAEYGLVLIDGKRVPNTERNISSSPANRNRWVAIENIERIEVIRGAASSLYGSDALSGVINIITKKAGEQWQSSVTANAQSLARSGGEGSGVNISTRGRLSERAALTFSVDHQDENAVKDDDGLTIQSQRRVTNTNLGLSFDVNEDSKLNFGVIYGEESAVDLDSGSENGLDQIKRLFSAGYTTKLGNYNTSFDLSNGDTSILTSSSRGENDWRVVDNNASVEIDGAITDTQYLSAGIGYRVEKANRYDLNFSDTFKSSNVFLQDVIDLNENHALTIGLSAENHNKYGSEVSPKIYWNWTLDPRWTFKAGYSEGRIAPAIREGSSEYSVSGGITKTYQGNDDLKPEQSQTFEVSANYDDDRLSAGISLFNTDVDNLITTENFINSGHTTALYSNVDKARVRGVESSIGWKINQQSKIAFNYTYLDAQNRSGDDQGNDLTRRSKHEASLSFDQHLAAIDSDLSLSWKGLSSQYTDSANTQKIKGHGLIDIGLVKSLSDNLEISAAIKNLGDVRVMDGSEALNVGREYRLSLTGRF